MSYHPKVRLLDRSVWVLSGYIIEQDGSRTDILELAYHKHIAEFFYLLERENPFPLGEGMRATNLDSQCIV